MKLIPGIVLVALLIFACSKEEDSDPPKKTTDPACFEVSAYTDQLPNMNFETWGYPDSSEGKYLEPCGGVWSSSNAVSQGILNVSTSLRSNDAGNGSFAVQVETKSLFGFAIFPGVFFAGRYKSYNFSGLDVLNNAEFGVPFTKRPQKLNGLHKYTSVSGDSAYIAVMLSRYNTTTKMKDTVAFGELTLYTSVTNYSQFDVALNYTYPAGSEVPDSVVVLFASSKGLQDLIGSAGSTLFIDNCQFVY